MNAADVHTGATRALCETMASPSPCSRVAGNLRHHSSSATYTRRPLAAVCPCRALLNNLGLTHSFGTCLMASPSPSFPFHPLIRPRPFNQLCVLICPSPAIKPAPCINPPVSARSTPCVDLPAPLVCLLARHTV
eukprot:351352-Chlamydomonas_euryale.AAC.4